MSKFVLWNGEVWKVIRTDHFGNPNYLLLQDTKSAFGSLRYVNYIQRTPLDPALYVLFKRKEND